MSLSLGLVESWYLVFLIAVSFLATDISFNLPDVEVTDRFSILQATSSNNNKPDSTLAQLTFSPWSQEPICTRDFNEQLCIYSVPSFNNGTGLVFFTAPDIASSLISVLTSKALLPSVDHSPFQLSNIPGKGLGLLATKRVPSSMPILTSLPIALFHPSPDLNTHQREHYYSLALAQLPAPTQSLFRSLSYPSSGPHSAFPVQSILKHNAFDLHLYGVSHHAVYPAAARLNHDCAPSAQYNLDASSLQHSVQTVRNVEVGEEVTISYVSPLQPTAVRNRMLKEAFGFDCRCKRCINAETNDAVLGEMQDLQEKLSLFVSNPDLFQESQIAAMLSRLLALYDSQSLQCSLEIPYSFAANVATVTGNTETARMYANLTAHAMAISKGPRSREAMMWREVAHEGG